MAATNLTVEILYPDSLGATGGTFHDITSDCQVRDPITINWGRADLSQRISPSRLSLTLDNRTGKYSSRNPLSPLYGLIGRNTPIRVSAPSVTDTFTRNVSGSWGTPDVGPAWSGSASQFSVNGSAGLMSHGGSGALSQTLGVVAADVDIYVDIDPATPAGTGNAEYSIRTRVNGTTYIEFIAFGVQASAPTIAVREIVSGSQVQLDGFTSISGVSAGAAFRLHVQVIGGTARMRAWAIGATEPTTWARTITNFNAANTGAGTLTLRSSIPAGWTNTPPIVTSFDNFTLRSFLFVGEIEAWPVRWDVSGKDVSVPITANGITRRLNAPGTTKPAVSAAYKSNLKDAPFAYWAMESDAPVDGLVSTLPSGYTTADLTIAQPYVKAGAATDLGGSKNLPEWTGAEAQWLGATGTDPRSARGTINTVSPPTSWSISIAMRGTRPEGNTEILAWGLCYFTMSAGDNGRLVVVDAQYAPGASPLFSVGVPFFGSGAGLSTIFADQSGINTWDGNWHEVFLTCAQSGGNYTYTCYIDGVADTQLTRTSATLPYPLSIALAETAIYSVGGNQSNNIGSKLAIGHVRYDAPAASGPMVSRLRGYTGELATVRMARLCTEEGISFSADSGTSEALGVQRIAPFVDLMFDAADADGGILSETLSSLALAYRTRVSLYNQAATLTLNYSAGDEVAPDLVPVEDTDATGNDITVTRLNGGKASAVQATGTLNVQEPPLGVGRYKKDVTLVLATDSQCLQAAAWLRHLGTWDEARFPIVNVDLTALNIAGKTTLIGNAANLEIGDRISISNPPSWLPPDSIELLVQGLRQTLGSHHWAIAINAVPAGPWDVYQIQTDVTFNRSRIPAAEGETTLFEAMTSGQTRMVVNSTTVKWIDSIGYAAQFPFDIAASGERIRVTASANYLNANPYFETNAASWSAQNGATIARSTAQFHEGAASLLITPDGSSFAPQATSEEVPAVAGRTYTVSGWIRSTANATRKLGLFWYDAAHSLLSSNEISTALSAGVWTQMGPTGFVAPANTAFLRIFTNDPSNPLASNTWFLDEATVTSGNLQVFTVTRSINGIAKAQTAGTAVQLFRPPRIAR